MSTLMRKITFAFLIAYFFGTTICFADPFYWGVASAAFQVEGSPADSDWKIWTHTPGKIEDGTNADRATDFWNRYDEDFQLAGKTDGESPSLGANAFRISLAWERIEPEKGKFSEDALNHYLEMVKSMRQHGLEPFLTLHHFAFPLWVAKGGGPLADSFPNDFAEYAEKVVQFFAQHGSPVHFWMTFNEPNVLAYEGYIYGEWPPGEKGPTQEALKVQFNLAQAHLLAAHKMKIADPTSKVGIALHWRVFQPKRKNFLDARVATVLDFLFNRYFLNTIVKGSPCTSLIQMFCAKTKISTAGALDFIGVNYYSRSLASFTVKAPYYVVEEGTGPHKNDLGWEIYPEGLGIALKDLSDYKKSIVITENGIADHADRWRSSFLLDHIKVLKEAQRSGIDVMGYFYWSLTDNFEWARGLKANFGLVEIRYDTFKRIPRPSFYTYQKIIKDSQAKSVSLERSFGN